MWLKQLLMCIGLIYVMYTLLASGSYTSGVATPGHTQACAHIKFTGAG